MTVLVIVVSALIVWLLRETRWLSIHLSGGTLPPEDTKPVVKAEATVRPQLRGVAEATVRPQLWRITEAIVQHAEYSFLLRHLAESSSPPQPNR